MAGFFRMLAYAMPSMVVANAMGALVSGCQHAHQSCSPPNLLSIQPPETQLLLCLSLAMLQMLLFLSITNGFSIVRLA